MSILDSYLAALGGIMLVAVLAWLVSIPKRDVSFVDSLWSLFFLLAAGIFAASAASLGLRGTVVLLLAAVWALRLSVYITARNWGAPEDYRYRSIRENNEPNFVVKSLLIVFGLQGLLAWVICIPLLVAIRGGAEFAVLDIAAAALWLVGFVFEAGGDYQLARFKADPSNSGKVLNTGLWRYTRHPNYFGDFCIWWSFYLFALSVGGWWTFYGPLLMTLLLLKVSGVAMLEKTIGSRRPGYAEYVANTNAFFPGVPSTRGVSAVGDAP